MPQCVYTPNPEAGWRQAQPLVQFRTASGLLWVVLFFDSPSGVALSWHASEMPPWRRRRRKGWGGRVAKTYLLILNDIECNPADISLKTHLLTVV